jgi:hypothetical protein
MGGSTDHWARRCPAEKLTSAARISAKATANLPGAFREPGNSRRFGLPIAMLSLDVSRFYDFRHSPRRFLRESRYARKVYLTLRNQQGQKNRFSDIPKAPILSQPSFLSPNRKVSIR